MSLQELEKHIEALSPAEFEELSRWMAARRREEARRAAIESLQGKYAHLSVSSGAVRAERELDKQREDRFNARFGDEKSIL